MQARGTSRTGLGSTGLDINGCVLSYFEGTANVQATSYTSCTLTTLHCSKVSFLQCCHIKRYNKIFTIMWEVYSLLWDTVCVCVYIYIYTHTHTQSWLKISAPLQFCQKMHYYFPKIVPIANILVFTCLLFLFALRQHKKQRSQKWTGQNYWHLVKIVRNNGFSSMGCSFN